MSTEVDVYAPKTQATLPAKIQYAKALAESGLLPASYRRNPGNVLWAMEYGDMLGLSPMAAITGVHVIEGKPGASAGLISALVRRAGHKLRVRGDSKSATCEITRADDPDFTFTVTWTLRKNGDNNPSAEEAGLLNKGTWKNYPSSMLKSRAITQCARDACEEALYGLHYTPEELGAEVDEDGEIVGEAAPDAPAEPSAAQAPSAPADPAAEDAGIVRDPPEDWTDATVASVPNLTDVDAARALYQEAKARAKAGEITEAQSGQVCSLIIARIEELTAPPVEGTVSAPDGDPWQAKIEEITSEDDAKRVREELDTQHKGGILDSRRHKALCVAIRVKVASLPKAAA